MKKLLILALLNFKIAIKEKTFWIIGFLFIFLLAFSFFLGQLALGQKEVILKIASLSFIELTALLLVVFGFVFNFYKEKETRLQEVYLSHFSSLIYLGAKLLSYLLVCFLYIVIALIFLALVLGQHFTASLIVGGLGIFLKLSLFSALALFFSALFNYPLLSTACLFFVYLGSELAYGAYKAAEITESAAAGFFLRAAYYIMPNADKLDFKYAAAYNQLPGLNVYLITGFYALCYLLFSLFLTNLIFSYKEH